jgi:ELWxxDGT repeat protein
MDLVLEQLEERIVLDGAVTGWTQDADGVWHANDPDDLDYYWYSPDGNADGVDDYYFRFDSTTGQWERDSDTLVSVDWNDDTWVAFGDPDADSAFVYDGRWHDMGDGYEYAYNLDGAGYGYWWYMNNGTEYYCAYGYDTGDWWWDDNGYYVGGGWNLFIDADGSDDFIYDGHQHDMGDGSLYTFFGSYGEWELSADNKFAYEYTPDQWWWYDGSQWYALGAGGADSDPIFDGAWHTLDVGLQYQYTGTSHVWDADVTGGFAYDIASDTWLVDTNDDPLNPLWETFDTQVATAEFLFDGAWHQVTDNHWLWVQNTQYAYWWSDFGQADTYYCYDMTADQWWRDIDGYYGSGDVWETFGGTGASAEFVYDGALYSLDDGRSYQFDGNYGYWWSGGEYEYAHDYTTEEWWAYDGSWSRIGVSGAWSVEAITDSEIGELPSDLTAGNGDLYFSCYDEIVGGQLWRYDPDTNTVTMVASGYSSSYDWWPRSLSLTPFDDDIFYFADNGTNGMELWHYDPDTNVASMLTDINPSGDGIVSESPLIPFNGDLYFVANDTIHGSELWRYDPVTETASMVADIWSGVGSAFSYGEPIEMEINGGDLYFIADDGSHGSEPWRYDPDTDTASMVADIWSGSNRSWASYLTSFNDDLFFIAQDNENGQLLWMYDPTSDTTTMITNGSMWADGDGLIECGGKLYFFILNFNTSGHELWAYDPLTESANSVAAVGSYEAPYMISEFNGELLYFVDDGVHWYEYWKYDPVSATTTMLTDGPAFDSVVFSYVVRNHTAVGDFYYCSWYDDMHGRDLWRYNPGTGEMEFVADVFPGPNIPIYPEDWTFHNAWFTDLDGDLFYVANGGLDTYDPYNPEVNGGELWTYNGIYWPWEA